MRAANCPDAAEAVCGEGTGDGAWARAGTSGWPSGPHGTAVTNGAAVLLAASSRSGEPATASPPTEPEVPGQFWIDFIRDTAPVFRKSTLEQLGDFIAPTWQALIDGSKYVDPRLSEIFDEVAPDVIVEDNVVAFPAIAESGRPWVRIVSCNPMEMKDERIAAMMGPKDMPFDVRRMAMGGFTVAVDL